MSNHVVGKSAVPRIFAATGSQTATEPTGRFVASNAGTYQRMGGLSLRLNFLTMQLVTLTLSVPHFLISSEGAEATVGIREAADRDGFWAKVVQWCEKDRASNATVTLSRYCRGEMTYEAVWRTTGGILCYAIASPPVLEVVVHPTDAIGFDLQPKRSLSMV